MDRIANIAIAIVGVATITALVAGKNTSKVITASGEAFSGAIKAALGR